MSDWSPEVHLYSEVSKMMPCLGLIEICYPKSWLAGVPLPAACGNEIKWDRQSVLVWVSDSYLTGISIPWQPFLYKPFLLIRKTVFGVFLLIVKWHLVMLVAKTCGLLDRARTRHWPAIADGDPGRSHSSSAANTLLSFLLKCCSVTQVKWPRFPAMQYEQL